MNRIPTIVENENVEKTAVEPSKLTQKSSKNESCYAKHRQNSEFYKGSGN